MPRQARLQRSTRYVALRKGVKKRWMAGGPVSVEGKEHSPQEILDELQALLDAQTATSLAYAAWRAQILRERALEKSRKGFVDGLEAAVRLLYGKKDTASLSDFGLEPAKKTGPKTADVKAAAAEKGGATRARRGTTGSRQKKKVKGGT